MTEGIATQHLVTAVEHLRKLRAYLAPRTAWVAEYGARDTLSQTHQAVAGLATAIEALMAANRVEADSSVAAYPDADAATSGELDNEQLGKVAAFVTRMQRWFAERTTAPVSSDGVGPLRELHRLLLEVLRLTESTMSHNRLGFRPFRAPAPVAAEECDEEELPDHLSRLCPKCGAPRVAGSFECPACGVIYARAVQQAFEDGEAESLIAAREESHGSPEADASEYAGSHTFDHARVDVYDHAGADPYGYSGTGAYDHAAAGSYDEAGELAPPRPPLPLPSPATRMDRLRAAIDEDTWIFVVVALLIYLGVVGFMTGRLIGGSDSVRGARDLFHEATGRKMRFPLPNAMALNWVDHRFVVFTSSDQQLQLVLYTEGALARKTELDVLRTSVDEIIRLMELPIIGTSTRRGHIGPTEVEVRELRIGQGEVETGRAYMSVFANEKGRPVVVFMFGPKLEVRELAREVFVGG